MKKISFTDKFVIGICIFSISSLLISFFSYGMLYDDSLFYKIFAINYFYTLFGIPFGVLSGTALNITSLLVKIKINNSFKLNLWMFAIILSLLLSWKHLFWQAFMSV